MSKTSAVDLTEGRTVAASSIWTNRSFLILILSFVAASLASKVYALALPLVLYDTTHSPVPMATMRAVEFLPNLFLAFFIGVLVDRYRKRVWTQWMLFSQSALLLVLYLILVRTSPPVYTYYLFGFLLMTFNYGYQNARMAMVKHAVPHAQMTGAMSKFSVVTTLISLAGPGISGFVLMLASPRDGLLITCVLFIVTFFVSMWYRDEEVLPEKKSSFWRDLKDGWHAFTQNRTLVVISVMVVFLNCSSGMIDAMIVYFAKANLGLSNAALGLTLSVAGVGGFLGSLVVTYARRRLGLRSVLSLTVILLAASYLLLSAAHNVFVMALALFAEGVFGTIQSVCIWTYRQESTPSELIGRISGITGSIFKIGMPMAIWASGFLSEWNGVSSVFRYAAVLNVLLFLVLRVKRVRTFLSSH